MKLKDAMMAAAVKNKDNYFLAVLKRQATMERNRIIREQGKQGSN